MKTEIKDQAIAAIRTGLYKKNIHYMFQPGADAFEFAVYKLLAGTPGAISWITQQTHYKHGVQVHVSKIVSDDLLATDFADASRIENVPWLAPAVELYFEDPLLPTILTMHSLPSQLHEWFPGLDIQMKEVPHISALLQAGSDPETAEILSLQLIPEMYEEFLTTGQTPAMGGNALFSTSLSPTDNQVMCFMLHLALKVFVFASIPRFKAAPLSNKRMVYGGKPAVRNRPEKPAFRLSYLPKVIYQRGTSDPTGEKREFNGRRGHVRWYCDERFTTMKDKWDFIPPVADPATGKYPEQKQIFKVVKRKEQNEPHS